MNLPSARNRRFVSVAAILTICFTVLTAIWTTNSANAQGELKSRSLERQARQFLSLVLQDIRLSDDILINNYLLNLADDLAKKSNMKIEDLSYYVVVDPQINAFAGPGATFFINTGIITEANTEGELASVVAHELAHFKQDHLKRLVESYDSSKTPFFLAVMAGIAMGGDAGIATVFGAQAARVESMIDHRLAYEREADAVGLNILVSAGYHPKEAVGFMLRLEEHIREQGIRQSNIHNTHPITPERIASFKLRVAQATNVRVKQVAPDFQFAKIRAKVLFDWQPDRTTKALKSQLDKSDGTIKTATLYGLSMSLARDGNLESARQIINDLLQSDPENIWFLAAAAELEINSNNPKAAETLLSSIANSSDPDASVVENYTVSLTRMGRFEDASGYIRKWLNVHDGPVELKRVYALAANKAGDTVSSYIAESDYYFKFGELKKSMNLLLAAEQKATDFYSIELIREKKRSVAEELAWRKQ